MAHHVILMNFTEQGAKTVKDTVKRYQAAKAAAAKVGVNFKDGYWLQPANAAYKPIRAKDKLEISGVMVGLIRKL